MKIISAILLIFILGACANSGSSFKGLAGGVLSSTGLVSSEQADALVEAGEHIGKAAQGFTEEQEYYLGRSVAAHVLSKYRPVSDASLQGYVNRVGAAVVAYSDRVDTFGGYHFLVLESNEINALAAPGGFIFITSGFLKIIPDEDSLAAVLAHEVGHIAKGHGVSAISQANLTQALVALGKGAASSSSNMAVQQLTATFGDSVSDIVDTLLVKGYSRSQEYESDRYAYELLHKSQYDPTGITSMLGVLERDKKSGRSSGGWASTHPDPDDRLENLEDEVTIVARDSGGKSIRTARFLANRKGVL